MLPLTTDVFGYNESLSDVSFNLQKAQHLMAKSTQPNGFKTTVWINEDPQINDTALYIQEKLKNLNIDVSIRNYEYATLFVELTKNEHDMFILGWSTVTADADYIFNALFESSAIKEANNRTNFSNEMFYHVIKDARQERNTNKRLELYRRAQEVLLEELPATFLYNNQIAIGYNKEKLDGIKVESGGRYQNRSYFI